MDTVANARTKEDCLWQSWNRTSLSSDARPQLVKNIKALFEIKGQLFTAAEQNNSLALYTDSRYSSYKYSCSGWPAPDISAATCYAGDPTELPRLNAQMDLCYRLASKPRGIPAQGSTPGTGLSVATFAQNTDACSGAIAQINNINSDPSCGLSNYAAGYDAFAVDILNESAFNLTLNGTTLDDASLQAQLAHVGNWYVKNRTTRYNQQVNPTELWNRVSQVLAGFWNGANAIAVPSTTRTDDASARARGVVNSVLRAALHTYGATNKPPLVGAPLLEILGDGIKPVSSRLTTVSLYHDFGCLAKHCQTVPGFHSQALDLWRLFSATADATELRTAVTVADRVPPLWRSIF